MDIGAKLKKARLQAGMTQEQVAEALGVSRQTISNWENENIQPSIDMLIRLAKLFGVTTDYLLGLDAIPRLSIEGLTDAAVAHLSLLIGDLKQE